MKKFDLTERDIQSFMNTREKPTKDISYLMQLDFEKKEKKERARAKSKGKIFSNLKKRDPSNEKNKSGTQTLADDDDSDDCPDIIPLNFSNMSEKLNNYQSITEFKLLQTQKNNTSNY
jgi:hypothetical protein